MSGVQNFKVSAYYDEEEPINRLSDPIDVFLTVTSSYSLLSECLSKGKTSFSISDPQYDNFTIVSSALGVEHIISYNYSTPYFFDTWFILKANGVAYSDPENDTILPIIGNLVRTGEPTTMATGVGLHIQSLGMPTGFVGVIYKLEMSLSFGPGKYSNDSRIIERGRTKVALNVKIGYDNPIQFGEPTYSQAGNDITIKLPIIYTNGGQSSSQTRNFESQDTLIYGIFDVATNEIFQSLALDAAGATFALSVTSLITGNIHMAAIAITATAVLIVYLVIAKEYQKQRTSNGFDFMLVMMAILLITPKFKTRWSRKYSV